MCHCEFRLLLRLRLRLSFYILLELNQSTLNKVLEDRKRNDIETRTTEIIRMTDSQHVH